MTDWLYSLAMLAAMALAVKIIGLDPKVVAQWERLRKGKAASARPRSKALTNEEALLLLEHTVDRLEASANRLEASVRAMEERIARHSNPANTSQ